MRVLITGGAGFIGSHLAERLLARGDQVVVIDNYATGRRDNLTPHDYLTVVEGSIADAALVHRLCRTFPPDVMVHAAASYKDPHNWSEDACTNVMGSAHVVQAAQRAGAALNLFSDGCVTVYSRSNSPSLCSIGAAGGEQLCHQ